MKYALFALCLSTPVMAASQGAGIDNYLYQYECYSQGEVIQDDSSFTALPRGKYLIGLDSVENARYGSVGTIVRVETGESIEARYSTNRWSYIFRSPGTTFLGSDDQRISVNPGKLPLDRGYTKDQIMFSLELWKNGNLRLIGGQYMECRKLSG